MAFDFPNSPTVGQKYPSPSIVGVPTYTWDGQKWITSIGGPMGVVTKTVFTSTVSAWSVPAGTSEMIIEGWGGGASGAGQASSAQRGAGGGGGAYGYKEYTGVMDSTLNIIVGAAAASVAGVGGNNGNGTQISGANLGTLTAGGGVAPGAAGFAASGGGGGVPSGPWTFAISGGHGTTSGPTSTPSAGAYGLGGDSPRGGGGGKSNVGTAGNFPGGGGSGENHTGGGSGGGSAGQVIISTIAGVSGGAPFSAGGPGFSKVVAAGSAHTINLTAKSIGLFDTSGNIFNAFNVSISISTTAVGAGGVEASTTVSTGNYYYYVIYNPTTKQVAGTISYNSDAPITMPAGFTFARRMGWIYASGGNIQNFFQWNAQFKWQTPPVVITGGSGLVFYPLLNYCSPFATRVAGYLISNNNTVSTYDNDQQPLCVVGGLPGGQCVWNWSFVPSNATLGIYYSASSAGAQLGVRDWEDNI